MSDTLKEYREGEWWFVPGALKDLLGFIFHWKWKPMRFANFVVEIGYPEKEENIRFYGNGSERSGVFTGFISYEGNPRNDEKGKLTMRIMDEVRSVVHSLRGSFESRKIASNIVLAAQELSKKDSVEPFGDLKRFAEWLASKCCKRKFLPSTINPLLFNVEEIVKFVTHVSQKGQKKIDWEKELEDWKRLAGSV